MGRTHPFIFILIFTLSLPSLAKAENAVEVCASCKVKSLQEAVASARAGETILVQAGTYKEHDIAVDKPLKIRAAPNQARPVIDLEKAGSGFVVNADDVEISGFLIKDSGFSHTKEIAAIKIANSFHCRIQNNQLENNTFGIYLAEAKSCTIAANRIRGTNLSESLSGNGIHIWNSENMTIENNQISANRDGIYFEFVKNSSIRKNTSSANLRYGLHFMYSHFNEYRENLFRDNECGVAVMYSHGVQMFRNRFEHSHGPSSYGILLKDISDSFVGANIFLENTVGIFADGTTRTDFEANLLKNNGWALRVLGDTDSNKFTRNDFIANTFDVATNASQNRNEFSGNYWSRYKGLDLNGDGFGDEPYRPVRLSSLLIENYQASILLIHSLFFTTLDQVENAMPFLTPETFRDLQPRMKRVTEL